MMKRLVRQSCIACVLVICGVELLRGNAILVGDTYNTPAIGTGFNLGSGVNSGINPPTTRLTGTAAVNLRYLLTAATKTNTAFSISGNKLRVIPSANPGRFTLSADGTTPFNFASVLGTSSASPSSPVVYDLTISMANNSAGVQRFSFAIATAEGDATTWDFGVQLFRTAAIDSFYTIGKRIDIGASGLATDLNSFITNTAAGTYGTEIAFLLRVTDAGAESSTFHSRLQLSTDGGLTWIYDTDADPDLPNGWRLDGAGRYILWDVAGNAGPVTYDNFSLAAVSTSVSPVSPPSNAQNIGAAPGLKVAVSNSAPGNLTVTYYGHEVGKPYPGPDFLIPVLPDTQNYAKANGAANAHQMWYSQTEWIITNRVQQNIVYVAQLGDVVQNGDILNGAPNDDEWEIATNAMYRLENPGRTLLPYGIPYGCAVGNHDQEPNGEIDGTTTHFNQYFGTAHFSGKPYYGGHFDTNNDSFFDLFSAGGLDFIAISFEFDRYGSAILGWAASVLATNQNRRVIFFTHYVGNDCGGTSCGLSASGQAFYDAFKSNTNFFLMLGGHVFNGAGDGEGSRSDTFNGHTVHTLVSDYQGRTAGGDGIMLLMYFSPSNNTVSIKTYSSWTDTYETDANSEFSFNYNMQLPTGPGTPGTAYSPIGTNLNVASGGESSVAWPGLQPNKTYEWYAKVTDSSGYSITSAPRRFTTGVNTPPTVSNLAATVTGDQPAQLTLKGSDPDGDVITYRTNSWPAHGVLSGFDSINGTLTYLPAHAYHGADRFTFQVTDSMANSSVGTMNLTVAAPVDANNNGLPDAWEAMYGVTAPGADDDGDGQNNLAEYLANTNPTNAASALKILGAAYQADGHVMLTWSSAGGTRYRIQYCDGNPNNSFTDIVRPVALEMDNAPPGQPSTQNFTDTSNSTSSPRFYRIELIQ